MLHQTLYEGNKLYKSLYAATLNFKYLSSNLKERENFSDFVKKWNVRNHFVIAV